MAQSSLSSGAIAETETVLQARCLLAANSRKMILLPNVAATLRAVVERPALVPQAVDAAENQVTDRRHFDCSLGCLSAPAVGELATQLASLPGLSALERDV